MKYIIIKIGQMYQNTPGGGQSYERLNYAASYNICPQCNDKYSRTNNQSKICLVCENENLKSRYSRDTISGLKPGNGPIKPNMQDYGRIAAAPTQNNYFADSTPSGYGNDRRSTQPRSVSQVPQNHTSNSEYGISQVMKEVGRQMNSSKDDHYGLKGNKCIARFGLSNMDGQLNCFLNSALQSLWNLSPVSFSLKFYCYNPLSEDSESDQNQSREIISEIKNFFKIIVDDRTNGMRSNPTPRYDANKLRKALFQRFYLMNQFILNQKADAAEVFIYLLDTIHSGCISSNSKKLQYERECDRTCFIHDQFHLKLKQERVCECGKMFPNDLDQPNNFTFIVPVQGDRGLLAVCEKIMGPEVKKEVPSRFSYSRSTFETVTNIDKIQQKFANIVKQSYQIPENICISPGCSKSYTRTKIFIEEDHPKIVTFNLNYTDPTTMYPDSLLKIFTSISNTINIGDVFELETKSMGAEYEFKGFTGFLGAHYVAFFRTLKSDLEYDELLMSQDYDVPFKSNRWTIYDDVGIRDFVDWASVVKCCSTDLIKPTLLFYQRIHPQVKRPSDPLSLSSLDLYNLDKQARSQTIKMKELDNPMATETTTDIRQQAIILEQIQREHRAKKITVMKGSPIKISKIEFKEEFKMSTDHQQLAMVSSDGQVESRPDKREVRETIRKLKAEYQQKYGVYVYRCQKCRAWIDFTIASCECKATNYYYDPLTRQDVDKSKELRDLLLSLQINDSVIVKESKEEVKAVMDKPPMNSAKLITTEIKEETKQNDLMIEKTTPEELKQNSISIPDEKEQIKLNVADTKKPPTPHMPKIKINSLFNDPTTIDSQENDTARKVPPLYNVKSATKKISDAQPVESKPRVSIDVLLKTNPSFNKLTSPSSKVSEMLPKFNPFHLMSVDGPLQIEQHKIKEVDDEHPLIGYESDENNTFRENYNSESTVVKINPSELKDQALKSKDSQQESDRYICPGKKGIYCGNINQIQDVCKYCGFYIGNLDDDITEKKHQKGKKENGGQYPQQDPRLKGGDYWQCEKCEKINLINMNDILTHICVQCHFRNDNISSMYIQHELNKRSIKKLEYEDKNMNCPSCQKKSFNTNLRNCYNCNYSNNQNHSAYLNESSSGQKIKVSVKEESKPIRKTIMLSKNQINYKESGYTFCNRCHTENYLIQERKCLYCKQDQPELYDKSEYSDNYYQKEDLYSQKLHPYGQLSSSAAKSTKQERQNYAYQQNQISESYQNQNTQISSASQPQIKPSRVNAGLKDMLYSVNQDKRAKCPNEDSMVSQATGLRRRESTPMGDAHQSKRGQQSSIQSRQSINQPQFKSLMCSRCKISVNYTPKHSLLGYVKCKCGKENTLPLQF